MPRCVGCGEWFSDGTGITGKSGDHYCKPECYLGKARKSSKELAEILLRGIYRVWWMPRFPEEPFHVMCEGLGSAVATIKLLSDYDLYMGHDDESRSSGGMEVYRDGDWHEWYSEDGEDINDFMAKGGI